MTGSPTPDAVTVSEVLNYYDSWLRFRQRYLRLPGIQAAAYLDGRLALSTAYGHADVEAATPLRRDHLFRIASQSKTFTSTIIFRLVEAGTLRLDDPAGRWVSALRELESPLAHVTVRELLSHSAGVARDGDDGDFWQLHGPFPDRDDLLHTVCSPAAAVLHRNERFKYSNIGFGLLGLIIESATGRSFAEVFRSWVVEPLGLRRTGPDLCEGIASDLAVGYSALSYSDHRIPIEHVDTRALAPATGAYSTASDLVRYFSAHFLGDSRLLNDDTKRQMQQTLWDVEDDGRGYALGLGTHKLGDRRLIGHGGGYPGHSTYSLADPDAGIAISTLTNAIDGNPEPLALGAFRLLNLATERPRPSHCTDSRLLGRFASLWRVVDIATLGGRLYLLSPTAENPTAEPVELEPVNDCELRITRSSGFGSFGEVICYRFGPDGQVQSIRGPSATSLVPIDQLSLGEKVVAPM